MWPVYALLNPLSESLKGVFSKKASSKIDWVYVTWFNNLIPMIFFFPLVFFIDFRFNAAFWIGFAVSANINLITVFFYHKSISLGDISEVVPMTAFTPLFMILTSPLIAGEYPTAPAIAGILLIVVGSYMLNIKKISGDFLAPLKSLVINKGTRYMLYVAVLWSISANFDKIAIRNASIWQYIMMMNTYIALMSTIYIGVKKRFDMNPVRQSFGNLFMVGFFTTTSWILHFMALALTYVAYVVALKRLAGLFSVGFGYFIFGDKNILSRLAAAIIMLTGVLLIIFSDKF
ncbi:MAG: EamA family transporter [Ignavibacteriaceae bacterium]|nr:EamA family transporter [Ignavibacteriaceae bacterium]